MGKPAVDGGWFVSVLTVEGEAPITPMKKHRRLRLIAPDLSINRQ